MKKLWKMALLTILGTCIALCLGISAAAETHSGTVSNYLGQEFFWEVNTDTGILTIECSETGTFPYTTDPCPWEEWEESIQELVLLGPGHFGWPAPDSGFQKSFKRIAPKTITSRWGDGFSWVYDKETKTMTYSGNGRTAEYGWNFNFPDDYPIEKVVVEEGYVWGPVYSSAKMLVLPSTICFPENSREWTFGADYIEISPSNPHFCSYDGAVYSKDGSSLYYASRADVNFHPNLRYLEQSSLQMSPGEGEIVLPWGLLTVNGGAFQRLMNVTVILPDTLTFVSPDSNYLFEMSRDKYTVTVRFSKNNKVAIEKLTGGGNAYGSLIPDIVDSVAEYYPDIPEAQGQSSTPVSEPSQPPVSQPESSQNTSAVSQPESSRPSSNSSTSSQTPTTPSSQSSTSSVTSSQPVSKPASEPTLSSQPEESSMLEESSAVSEAPSSEVSVSKPESSLPEESELSEPSAPAEQSGGFSSLWPVFLALGAAVICAAVIIFLIWRKRH